MATVRRCGTISAARAATRAAAIHGLPACVVVRLMMQPGVMIFEVLVQTIERTLLGGPSLLGDMERDDGDKKARTSL
ncbi:hypothetical protein Tco_1257838, partial [Tanacetum coccineum]